MKGGGATPAGPGRARTPPDRCAHPPCAGPWRVASGSGGPEAPSAQHGRGAAGPAGMEATSRPRAAGAATPCASPDGPAGAPPPCR